MPSKAPSPKALSPIEAWRPEAEKLPSGELKVPVPLHALYGEAVDLAKFYEKYWESQPGRPGLDSVASKERGLHKHTGEELLSLRQAAQDAGTAYRLSVSPSAPPPFERAEHVLDEITATLEWLFDDGVEDEKDAQLAALKKEHTDSPDSHDAWAAELEDYAALAAQHEKQMKGLGGFDVALIAEARQLAALFRDRPAMPAIPPEEVKKASELRNRLATLLWKRMSSVRGAARFVFRRRPDIVREATSAYERRRRAANRRAAQDKKNPGDEK
jgi:hypothetical protein